MNKIFWQEKVENIVFGPKLPYFCHIFFLKLSLFDAECNFASNIDVENISHDILEKSVRKIKLAKT
jgi:hypothetical protein